MLIIMFNGLKHTNTTDNKKSVFISDKDGTKTMVIVDPKPIRDISTVSDLSQTFFNSRFRKYEGIIPTEYEISVVSPATDAEIHKMDKRVNTRKFETYEEYLSNEYPEQDLEWIYNILDGKIVQEEILYQDDQFVFLPDIKWDKKDMSQLYCLAIVKDRSLKSIRELTAEHIPLLEHIYEKGVATIQEKYGYKEEDLRVYFHYYPTYWHLHIHFNLVNNRPSGTSVDSAHTLKTVVRNLSVCTDYYQKAIMEIVR